MKNAYRVIIALLLVYTGFSIYRFRQLGTEFEYLGKVMINVAGNSYFTGCMSDQPQSPARAETCKGRATEYVEALLKLQAR